MKRALIGLLLCLMLGGVLAEDSVRACKACGDCNDEFGYCVTDCPTVDGFPEQSCYTSCRNAQDRCFSFCCGRSGGGSSGGGCPSSCPYNCDASGTCF